MIPGLDPTADKAAPTIFANARLVLADRVVDGYVVVQNGTIIAIETGQAPTGSIDMGGDFLLPGLVDIHTDHFEKHVFPRAHVRWDFMRAALSHDAQIIGGGITTVFDSICVGATHSNPERREILAPMIDALETAEASGMLRAQHFVHLRCEITDTATPALTAANIGRDIVKIISVMEHVPGVRQSRDIEGYLDRMRKHTGKSDAVLRREMEEAIAYAASVSADVRPQIIELALANGLPLLSHDDTEIVHVDEAKAEGIAISEFPCTVEAAQAARDHGMNIVMGAPNLLRGGSQSGNVAVRELMQQDLVDILASDYVPRSLIDVVFAIADDAELRYDLPAAVRMVSKAPAEAAGLNDRGEIAIGRRADLLQVASSSGHPHLKRVWRAGLRVA